MMRWVLVADAGVFAGVGFAELLLRPVWAVLLLAGSAGLLWLAGRY